MQIKTIETPDGEKRTIPGLLGGLALLPYGLLVIITAYCFTQGWLDWQKNGGPPTLGFLLALLIDRAIRRFYRKKFNYDFKPDSSPEPVYVTTRKLVLGLLALFLFAAVIYLDETLTLPVRFSPIFCGIFVVIRGIDWYRKNWHSFGMVHILIGAFAIGLGLIPLFMGLSTQNQYFGVDGILELSTYGFITLVIGVMEHLIVRQVHAFQKEPAIYRMGVKSQ